MSRLESLALILILAVAISANCAVSCLHPHSVGQPAAAAAEDGSPAVCHHAESQDTSDQTEDSGSCSHSEMCEERPVVSGKMASAFVPPVIADPVPDFSERISISFVPAASLKAESPPCVGVITILRI
jgi:hypothetical protein